MSRVVYKGKMGTALKISVAFSPGLVQRVDKINTVTAMLSLVEGRHQLSNSKDLNIDEESAEEGEECSSDCEPGDLSKGQLDQSQDTQTLLSDGYLKSLEDEYYKLKRELSQVKEKDIFRDMELHMFRDSDRKVRCLTGLTSYDMLKGLSDYISDYQNEQGKVTKFQQLMITLIKLKLNLPMPFLAILFNISLTTISRVFRVTVDLLYKRLVPSFIFWPRRSEMKNLVPSDLEDIENCLYSIDCFELDVEVRGCTSHFAKDKLDPEDTFLHSAFADVRKRKYFMSVAPQGMVIFISHGVSGEVNDRSLIAESGFFTNIEADDLVVSERSFNIDSEVYSRGASLEITRDIKTEYDDIVSVQQVISIMKSTYQILEDTILRNWVKDEDKNGICTCDKLVHIVSAFINMINKEGLISF